jgi:16S rRNA (guanine527-N7)-methyltransferase
MSNNAVSIAVITKYFPNISVKQQKQFQQLYYLYQDWNEKINVISRKDIDFLYERHVLHSLGIAKVCYFKDNTKILDIGTGGGFPGIPLAILFPNCQFHLVDSIGKKIKVVQEIANELKLENVTTAHQRAEEVSDKFDFIVSRAVTQLPVFLSWVKNKVSSKSKNDLRNGLLYLKGGDLTEELAPVKKMTEIIELSKFFEEPFFETKKVVYVIL